jgi:hypothetical protein
MVRRSLIVLAVIGLLAAPAVAQERVEISGMFGWTFSEGVAFGSAIPVNGVLYSRVDPKDSWSASLSFGVYITPQAEVEFLWNRQATELEVTGAGIPLTGDMNLDNFHGNFIYNAGDEDAAVRPFVFLGIGATSYGDAAFTGKTLPGTTKFSFAFGGGIKAWASRNVGFKAQARWVPTYIKTDGYGWWCDPYWGCTAVGNAHYAHQVEIAGGIVARF